MYQIIDLGKRFGRKEALRSLSLRFNKGQFVALMGENGAGKSTLLRILAQQELMTSGDVVMDGQTLRSPFLPLNERIAFISEEVSLPSGLSIEDWARCFQEVFSSYRMTLFLELMDSLRVDINADFSSLSRGQKVKALFCLHAAKIPDVYLLDEVTSVLDAASCFSLMRFLTQERERECLIVASTNIAAEMQSYATDLCFIDAGQASFYGRTQDFPQNFFKFRCSQAWLLEHERDVRLVPFKKVRINSDGTLSCLVARKEESAILSMGLERDRRAISLEDVAVYLAEGVTL